MDTPSTQAYSLPLQNDAAEASRPARSGSGSIRRFCRQLSKLFGFGVFVAGAILSYWRLGGFRSARLSRAEKRVWMQQQAKRLLRLLNIRVSFSGMPPRSGMLVSNHLSYLDIVVLGSTQPMTFLSKSEVRNWPVIGMLTRMAGTLYVDRNRRGDVARCVAEFEEVAREGNPIVLFPEGTSSGGPDVLPFRSSLLEPAAARQWQITPAFLSYSLQGGDVAREVCYWGDMTFFPHFLNLLGLEKIEAKVVFGAPIQALSCRKELSRHLHQRVQALQQRGQPSFSLTPDARQPAVTGI